jgi:hypothetical protein
MPIPPAAAHTATKLTTMSAMALVLDKAQIEDAILAHLAEAPIADSIDFAAAKNFDHSVRNAPFPAEMLAFSVCGPPR